MKEVLIMPVLEDSGNKFLDDRKLRAARLAQSVKGTMFEMIGPESNYVLETASNALRNYILERGHMPSDELLASAYTAISNALDVTSKKGTQEVGRWVLESADLSTTEGIMMRDRMIALILPVMLQSVTGNIVSYIPGTYNQSEIFKIRRIAAATFGDLTKGDIIDYTFNGQYSSMDQRFKTGTGDGALTGSANTFDLNATTKWGATRPYKKKSIKVYHDRNLVAVDDGAGALHGSFVLSGSTITVTGTVNYATGVVHPVFSTAPATGIEIHIGVDIDIEKEPTLIPSVNHEMDSRTLFTHESAIAAGTSLQALWGMRREYNINSDSMAMLSMRNVCAADKDRKHLNDMYFFMKGQKSWSMDVPQSTYFQEHYESIRQTLLEIDSTLLAQTGISGLVGLVADSKSSVLFRSMKAPFFEPAPGYVKIAQPHYVGRLFGMWDLFEDPNRSTNYSSLCYGKGRNIGESGYVAGDAIPAMAFKHAMQGDLKYNNTLWESAYRDLNPFDGRDWFMELTMTTEG
jgi:hypothetical protein